MRSDRGAYRLAVAAVLVLASIGSTAMADVRVAADVGLAELSAGRGVLYNVDHWESGWMVTAQAVRLEFGAEVTDHVGFTAGTALVGTWWLLEFSFLPVSARAYWDFTPNELWIRRTAYVMAAYNHHLFAIDEPSPPPYFSLGVGAACTFYAATIRAEVTAPALPYRLLELRLGLEVGGSYIFGRHHQPAQKG
jgi:hypothetical protein